MNKKIIDQLTTDVLKNEYFLSLFNKCSIQSAQQTLLKTDTISNLSLKEFRDTLRFADILSHSDSPEGRNKAYQLITFLNQSYSTDGTYSTIAKAVYSRLGNFPAIKYLEVQNQNKAEIPFDRMIGMEAKKIIQKVPDSETDIFTDSQYELYNKLSNSLKYSFSGPTSMGKSFIIKAFIRKVIKNSPPENLVVLVPTRALINQFTLDLKTELGSLLQQYRFKVVTNSNISDLITEDSFSYILVLTPERLISYLSQISNPPIGFLFVDEAHKLAQAKDSRSVTTYSAIEKTLSKYGQNVKLYFSSPNVSNPSVFLDLFQKQNEQNFYRTEESPVSQNLYFIDLETRSIELIQNEKFTKIDVNFETDFSSVNTAIKYLGAGSNNLVYNNSKTKTILGAKDFADSLDNKNEASPELKKAIQQIKEYIHPNYYLAELLEKRVGYHHGKLPQLIRNLVEDLYKKEEVSTIFCTSTLLEGVNMPTKNLFILNNQNGAAKLEEIDFWNLTGRAGRLNKELFGNIYCIKHPGCDWENKENILVKRPIELQPTVLTRIDRNLKKIEKLLSNQDISGTDQEKEILKYIANIICTDSMELRANYRSPIIEQLINDKKDKILELAKSITKNINVPLNILGSNQSINVTRQQKIYSHLKALHAKKKNIKLPSSNSENFYLVCKQVLEEFYDLYEWGKSEKKLSKKTSMAYYATIMNQWIKGFSLNQIINQSLEFHSNNNRTVKVDFNTYVPFEKGNLKHINIIIEDVIDNIEYILRFLFEKYFNHYHQMLVSILGEKEAGENWATLLEYGTQNRTVIAFQNLGLSRHTATSIYNKCKDSFVTKDSKLISINKTKILGHFKSNSIEFDEINKML